MAYWIWSKLYLTSLNIHSTLLYRDFLFNHEIKISQILYITSHYILIIDFGGERWYLRYLKTDVVKYYHIGIIFMCFIGNDLWNCLKVKKALGFTYIKYSWYIESDTTRKAIVVSSKTLVHVFCCCVCLVLLCLETNFGNLVVIANWIPFMNVARLSYYAPLSRNWVMILYSNIACLQMRKTTFWPLAFLYDETTIINSFLDTPNLVTLQY